MFIMVGEKRDGGENVLSVHGTHPPVSHISIEGGQFLGNGRRAGEDRLTEGGLSWGGEEEKGRRRKRKSKGNCASQQVSFSSFLFFLDQVAGDTNFRFFAP